MRPAKIALIVLCATVFGCIMAAREMVDSAWGRALAAAFAALAAAGLGVAVNWFQTRAAKESGK